MGIGPDSAVSSDADGGRGDRICACLRAEWFAERWLTSTTDSDIAIEEMIPLAIAAEIWAKMWERRRILFRSDNTAVVNTLKYGLCRDRHLAFCFRELAIRAVLNNFTFTAMHIPVKFNKASVTLSRLNLQLFKSTIRSYSSG